MDGTSRKAARAIYSDHSHSIVVLLIRAQRIAMSSQASPELTARAISFSPTDCGCSHASLAISSRRATSPPGYASRTPSVIITTTSPVCIVIPKRAGFHLRQNTHRQRVPRRWFALHRRARYGSAGPQLFKRRLPAVQIRTHKDPLSHTSPPRAHQHQRVHHIQRLRPRVPCPKALHHQLKRRVALLPGADSAAHSIRQRQNMPAARQNARNIAVPRHVLARSGFASPRRFQGSARASARKPPACSIVPPWHRRASARRRRRSPI